MATSSHGQRQCCAYQCHNRKGRCPELPGSFERVCGCPRLNYSSCPRSNSLLVLHKLCNMSSSVRNVVLQRVSRQDRHGRNWKPTAVICNMHYEERSGPSKRNKTVLPVLFVHRRFSLDRLVKFHPTDNMKPPEVIIRHAIRSDEDDRHETNEIRGAELDGAESDGNAPASNEPTVEEKYARLQEEYARLQEELSATKKKVDERKFSSYNVASDEAMKFFTGVSSVELFNTLWTWIEPAAESIRLFGSTSSSSSRDAETTSSSSSHDAETLVSSLELDHAYIEPQPQRDAFSKSRKLPNERRVFPSARSSKARPAGNGFGV